MQEDDDSLQKMTMQRGVQHKREHYHKDEERDNALLIEQVAFPCEEQNTVGLN